MQWRAANRRRQRQTNQHHGLVPNPPSRHPPDPDLSGPASASSGTPKGRGERGDQELVRRSAHKTGALCPEQQNTRVQSDEALGLGGMAKALLVSYS